MVQISGGLGLPIKNQKISETLTQTNFEMSDDPEINYQSQGQN